MYLPVEPGRLIEGPVNRGPENRGCTVFAYRHHGSGPHTVTLRLFQQRKVI